MMGSRKNSISATYNNPNPLLCKTSLQKSSNKSKLSIDLSSRSGVVEMKPVETGFGHGQNPTPKINSNACKNSGDC